MQLDTPPHALTPLEGISQYALVTLLPGLGVADQVVAVLVVVVVAAEIADVVEQHHQG